MKRLFLALSFAFILVSARAQIASNSLASFAADWHPGKVVFTTGDTVSCDIRFNNAIPVGILQIASGTNILTIAPEDVKSFFYYDSKKQRLRKFYSLAVTTREFSTHRAFLECLYDNREVSILSHKTLGVPYEYMNYTRFISKPGRVNRKYILDASTGELLPMSKENALRVVDDKPAVASFIESRRIRFKSIADYIDVFRYCSAQ